MTLSQPAATPVARAARTSAGQAELYGAVKAMAVRFEFKPGERINEVELARRLHVSRTPLREVLNQLMVEGFLTRAVNRGFIARLLDAKQIHSLYEYRAVLEAGIVRAACERATDDELASLRAFVERSRDEPDDSDAARLLELDEAFHLALARYSRNEEFVRALESVNARIHFVRWIDMQQGRRSHTQGEHLRIVDALQKRDIEALPGLISAHIGRRLDQITDVIRTGFSTIYMRDQAEPATVVPANTTTAGEN
ncbi:MULTISPECIES: GntR family transcriptional regulator [Achromobacter]|uniref:GntR family transcriptional regulator n=1 Tax=Achromobacter TaxID=222 RepID=UPI00174A4C82|nr:MULTISPECIES: GntR family transcriptional regulator [Achromobacter]